ncbi:prepilin-type N-terminal cleavage/methylation domain-containing protein [Sulfurimonas microaerophilic]|uniref:prepilin-type N-terminal cleavage/methylation domain-containing protein n=1 Tax=Sulfurimonas microaerophilic TaxID=3058392 RepID=UPI0027149871|nr:prepilin-type N-terminal cleavage/methylation domain-containing protein [Sulfurimonas sp. hsl 1-7]
MVIRMNNLRKRTAFTMIELIFAIVVISIVVLSVPTFMQVSEQNVENNLAQEAIFAASAELMGATSVYWDENSMQDSNFSALSRVIDISNDCNSTTNLRPGHINQPFHRRCLDNLTTSPANSNGGSVYDLNDLTLTPHTAFTDTKGPSGYKTDYLSTLSVTQKSTDNNVKIVTVTITDPDNNPITKLKAEVANIGEVEPYKKRMF